MADRRMVVTSRPPGVSLAGLIDRQAPEAIGTIREAGCWLGRLHVAEARIGRPWFPWRSIEGLAARFRAAPRRVATGRADLREMITGLAPLAARAVTGTWTQTHGRYRDDRVIAGPGVLTVDDFTRSAPGDPARDIGEFVFHLRRRAVMNRDPRSGFLAAAFLEGYLDVAPEANLANIRFYTGCAVLDSFVSDAPSDGDHAAWVAFHVEEFHRHVADPLTALRPPA
jgi:hypothetical protein